MVADVQSWLNNPSTNYGWLLQGDEAEGQTAKRYESAEANDGSVDVPTLQITYEDEGSSVPEPSSALLALTGVAWCGGMRIRRRGKR
ncbi:MAG: PEP-CTERM sorting domain-containing protein [Thermoguttaceae bacterium]